MNSQNWGAIIALGAVGLAFVWLALTRWRFPNRTPVHYIVLIAAFYLFILVVTLITPQ